jgi:uncharacterized protein (UPF0262 family)
LGQPDSHPADRIIRVTLDERSVVRRSAEVEHERAVAIYDLIEENSFTLVDGPAGPYSLRLSIEENRLVLDIRSESEEPLFKLALSLSPFRKIVRDYFAVCESYFAAIRKASPSQIEAIDMGRRGLHDEGAELLRERLTGKIDLDANTARRLFTLVCVLHIRG